MEDAAAWLARARGLEARGELLAAHDAAMQGLAAFPGDPWLAHRAVLMLAKAGATGRAAAEYERLGLSRSLEPDIAALGARIAKDQALAAPAASRAGLLARAADLYEAIHLRGGGYYPGVNAATLRHLAGQREAAAVLARHVLADCREAGPGDYFRWASAAEAALVLGDVDAARTALDAAARAGGDHAARASTRRQLRLLCEASGEDTAWLSVLAPPAVAHFTGHRVSDEGVAGRFPAVEEARVAAELRAALARHDVGFGYGALASGADLLVAEALLDRGAELHVVLPVPKDDFVALSVAPSGEAWVRRFEACLARASSVTEATADPLMGHEWIFAYGSYLAMGLAALRARFLDAEALQLAVWDGEDAGGVAGTGFDVRTWRAAGRETVVVPPRPAGTAAPAAARPAAPREGERELRAMLFGDIQGFSKLSESQVRAFVDHVLGAFAGVLSQYGSDVRYRNTWGDGLFVVLADAEVAARCALTLQAAMAAIDLRQVGLPDSLALRLGGHFGPVFEATDPVLGLINCFGAHVSRTARIEPVVPPGEVYVSEAFAARLALSREGFACDYVGVVPAAKGYGHLRMYHLRAP